MKIGAAVCAMAGLFFTSVVSQETFWGASAQSGRSIPKPTPPPSAESPKRPEAKAKFVADLNASKYKLIFPVDEDELLYKDPPKDGKERKAEEKAREKDSARRPKLYRNTFVEQLNKAGEQGYRLFSAIGVPRIGLAKHGEAQYEYTSFEPDDSTFFAKMGFEEAYERLSKQGFSLVDHSFLSESCYSPPDPAICVYRDLFIFERMKGVEAPLQFRFVRHSPRWRDRSGESELTRQINGYLAMGFYPTYAFSKFEILLHSATESDKPSIDMAEAQVITGSAKNVRKKVNELAQQGYRLAVTHGELAVMYRPRVPAPPVSYIWLLGWNKSFETELARLQDRGAIFRMIDTYFGYECQLVFEQPAVDDGKRREYRALKFELQSVIDVAEQKIEYYLAPSSKEMMDTFNNLVKEGFDSRDLFYSDKIGAYRFSVLLERSR